MNGRMAGVVLALSAAGSGWAGGYLSLDNTGTPYKWANTVTVNLDQGPLGSLSNAQADVMALSGINRWANANIADCALSFVQGADLIEDHGDGLGTDPSTNLFGDGITPIIYDQTGIITNAILGAGANQFVIGFAGPFTPGGGAPGSIVEGRAVMNGRFIDGAGSPTDITQSQMEGVFTHEIGHMLNLDHAQCNDAFANGPTPDFTGYPTMYPLAHSDVIDLELDDRAWISNLYPHASNTKTNITGVTRNNAAALINGVNIVARSVSNPLDAITCVSGYRDPTPTLTADGVYLIPGLGQGTGWVLDFERINPTFIGGSSVGQIDPPLTITAATEFLNESGVETGSDSITRSTTFVTPAVNNGTVSGVDLQLNAAPSTTNISEVDAGALFPGSAQTIPITPGVPVLISATITSTEGGNFNIGGDNLEDWYVLSPPAGLEITKITLTPTTDCDLYTIANNSGVLSVINGSAQAGNVVETIDDPSDSTKYGTGAGTGQVYLCVTNYIGEPAGSYTLRIETSVSDKDSLIVSGPDPVTESGVVDPTDGVIRLKGSGFKNNGGSPSVLFSKAGILVNSVSFVNSQTLDVNVTRQGAYVPGGTTDISVTNQGASGGYSGRRTNSVTALPVSLSTFEAE